MPQDAMIICHTARLVFVKTKKVGGTSFEIALSRHCGPDCIITPISERDEAVRARLGFRGPQNHEPGTARALGVAADAAFYNHMPAKDIKAALPDRLWADYKTVSITRNPYDVAISRYYHKGGEALGLDFVGYLKKFHSHLGQNYAIAPASADLNLDHYLRYERLYDDAAEAGLDFMLDDWRAIRTKDGQRPQRGASMAEMYRAFPQAAEIVEDACRREIEAFGYTCPV